MRKLVAAASSAKGGSVRSRTMVMAGVGVGVGVGVCALAATGALTAIRRRLFGATTAEACRPIVFCGPSGAGKSSLITLLREEFPTQFGFSVSHTTRAPREGEKDTVHYYFTNVEAMKKAIADKKFIEHANVHGNLYGTSYEAVSRVGLQKKICILDIDIQGVHACQKANMDATYIFISPPSVGELEKRLRSRGSETAESLKKRLLDARIELDLAARTRFDARIRNDDLHVAYTQLRELLRPQIEMCTQLRAGLDD